MAKIKQGILGGFSGRVGNVVGSSWKGIGVMKSLPLSVANPKTTGQVAQRTKFSSCLAIAQSYTTGIIKKFWNRFAVKMSGFNDFMSNNVGNFAADGTPTYANLLFSKGAIGVQPILSTEASLSHGTADITWDHSDLPENATNDDIMNVAIINETKGEQDEYALDTYKRSDDTMTVPFPATWELGDTLHFYLISRRTDGTVVSDTAYATSDVVA